MSLNTAYLFSNSVCNLNCSYCLIDKNPSLLEIDKMIEDSWKDENYYLNRLQVYFKHGLDLKRIEIWGGEPTLHFNRITPSMLKIVENYVGLENIFFSTNFSYDKWCDNVFNFIDELGAFRRPITIDIQLSIDGPIDITDNNRGVGTTIQCVNNFKKFVEEYAPLLPPNIYIVFRIKPTLNLENLRLLQTEEDIYNYLHFFELNFYEIVNNIKLPNIKVPTSGPTWAAPMPATKEDGILFANYVKLFKRVLNNNNLKYLQDSAPFIDNHFECDKVRVDCCNLCGTGSKFIGFLPNGNVCGCNMGFMSMISEYKKYNFKAKTVLKLNDFIKDIKPYWEFSDDEYDKYYRKVSLFNFKDKNNYCQFLISEIQLLAEYNEILPKYKDYDQAVKGANFCISHIPYCIRDNYNISTTWLGYNLGTIRLLLNGSQEEWDG